MLITRQFMKVAERDFKFLNLLSKTPHNIIKESKNKS